MNWLHHRRRRSRSYRPSPSTRLVTCSLLTISWVATTTAVAQSRTEGRRSATMAGNERRAALRKLPDIRQFAQLPSNRFLVDLDSIRTGHPYKGKNAARPHTGGHIYFRIPHKHPGPTAVNAYPAIYAVADGYVSRIDYSFRLREMFEPALKKRVANYRYGVGLMFAKTQGSPVVMHYSIEPFIDPQDPSFYVRFLRVQVGQRVKKGDIIARMYLPPNRDLAQKSHIHFNLIGGERSRFMSPSIFSPSIVKRFHATWGRFGNDGGRAMPPCMGFKLRAAENPFQSGSKETL